MENVNLLSGCYEVDQYILLFLDNEDYRNVRLTCRYLFCLLLDDTFWKNKITLCYETSFQSRHISVSTWKEWYYFWTKHNYALILIKTLRLTPQQVFISIISRFENKLLPGLEAFRSIELILEKAILSRDKELINYFMNRYNTLVLSLLSYDPEASPILPLINYCTIIEYFLIEGDDSTIKKIIDDMGKILEHFDRDVDINTNLDLLYLYGKYNRYDLAEEIIFELEDICESSSIQQYTMGLIIGYHNKEAIALIEKYHDLLSSNILFNHAIHVNNVEISDYLRSYYTDLTIQEGEMNINVEDDFDLKTLCPEIYQTNVISNNFNISHPSNKLDVVTIISQRLHHGCYDIILSLDLSSLKITGKEFRDLCIEALQTPYKDLGLYLLLQLAKYNPDNYQEIIETANEVCSGIFEMLSLVNELAEIPTELLNEVNYYALLMQPYSSL